MLFYLSSFAFLFGILARSFFNFGLFTVLIFFLLSFVFLVLHFYVQKSNFRPKADQPWTSRSFLSFLSFALILSSFGLGILRFDLADKTPTTKINNELFVMEGIIVDEPDVREKNQKLIVMTDPPPQSFGEASANPDSSSFERAGAKVLVTTELYPEYYYGDRISFAGKLASPKNFENEETNREFDYVNYLAKDKIYYESRYPKIEVLGHKEGNKILGALFSIKKKFLENISQVIGEPEAGLLGGLVVGARSSLPEKLKKDLIRTGTIHIVALSGFNVTLVSNAIRAFFSFFLASAMAFSLAIGAIILFVLMTGAQATAVRAGIMAVLVLVARLHGKDYNISRGLVLAALFMVIHNPYVLAFDVSFQLSFLATIGIIYLTPIIEKRLNWLTKSFRIREVLITTLAAYIFVLPFLLYKMGTLSLVAIPANLLILPIIPETMAIGFFVGIFGFVSSILSFPFAYITYFFLNYELFIVKIFSSIPFAALNVGRIPFIFIILIYFILILLFRKMALKDNAKTPITSVSVSK